MQLMLGLIFSIMSLLFAAIGTLLIYSLLMISTETKRFENGLMSVVGLSKVGYANMILLQALLFVLPAIFLGFLCAIPGLAFIYANLFTAEMGFTPTYFPSGTASVEALGVGLLIPLLSAIIPIKIALSKTLSE